MKRAAVSFRTGSKKMPNAISTRLIGGLLFGSALPLKSQECNSEASKDHPLISLYPGSVSNRRTDAIAKVLATKYNVAATHLSAQDDGPTAPVASNEPEEDRSKNRGVELVKQ